MQLKRPCKTCGSMSQLQKREIKQVGCVPKWELLCECCNNTIMGKMIVLENHMFCSDNCASWWIRH